MYKIEQESNSAYYIYSPKQHTKVSVSYTDLSEIIRLVLNKIIQTLDAEKLIHHSILRYRTIKKHLDSELNTISRDLKEIIEELVLESDEYSAGWKEDPRYLKQEYVNCLEQIKENQNALQTNKNIIEMIKGSILNQSKGNPLMLCDMLINEMLIYGDKIEFEIEILTT
jgi:hypothetical protein